MKINIIRFLNEKSKHTTVLMSTIKIINTSKFTSLILLSLLLCLKVYAAESQNISVDSNKNNQTTQELLLAEFAINNNQPLQALEIYQKIALNTNDPQIAKRATELALENGRDDDALKTVTIWAKYEPNSTKGQLIASLLIMQYQAIEEARPYLINLFNSQDKEADIYTYIELLLGHPFDQEKLLNISKLLKSLSESSDIKDKTYTYLALSILYEKMNDGQNSLKHIDKALKASPSLQSAHIHKIRLLNIYQSTESALNYMEQILATFPKNDQLRKLYADILYDLEKWPEAKIHYEALIKSDDFQEDALLQLSYISINNSDLMTARKYLLKLTTSVNYSNIAHYHLGLISQQMGNLDLAIKHFNSVTDGEYAIRSNIRTATVLNEQNKLTEAKQIIDATIDEHKAADVDEATKDLILSETELLYQQGLYKDALAILNLVKAHYPDDSDIYYSIGIVANQLNNDQLFKENMTYVIENNPNNSNALSALGWHYFKNNDNQKAYTLLQKAYTVDQFNSSRIGSRYAAVLWRMGQKDKANEIWQKFLDLDPQNQSLRDMIDDTKKSKNFD